MCSDIAISVRHLTKTYRIFGHPGDRIKQAMTFGLRKFHKEFTALKDVSFEIKKGETVGIIGRNGSGKSTLLQLICGILKPTEGTVRVNGRISALLELGAGFNPEFTGRENVYFQGALTGFSKAQMDERFEAIAAFADIGEFIDQPVRIYSSGMYVRLAFAVAIHVDPDILVVDEALAVGDGAFQAKCLDRIDHIRKNGGTILIVTHSAEQVAHHCDRALLLDHAHLVEDAKPATVLTKYMQMASAERGGPGAASTLHTPAPDDANDLVARHPGYSPQETRWGDRQASITDIAIIQNGRHNPESLIPGWETEIRFCVHYHAELAQPIYGLAVKAKTGAMMFSSNSRLLLAPRHAPGQRLGDVVCPSFTFYPFLECGEYSISVGIASEQDGHVVPHDRRYDCLTLRIEKPHTTAGEVDMKPVFHLLDPS